MLRRLSILSFAIALAACSKPEHRPIPNSQTNKPPGKATDTTNPPPAILMGPRKGKPTEQELKTQKVREALTYLFVDNSSVEPNLTTDRQSEAQDLAAAAERCGLKSQQTACAADNDPKYSLMMASDETLFEKDGMGLYTVTFKSGQSRISYVFRITQIEPEVKCPGAVVVKDGVTLANLTVNQDIVGSTLKRIPSQSAFTMAKAARMGVNWLFLQRTKGMNIDESYKKIIDAVEAQGDFLARDQRADAVLDLVNLVETAPWPVPKEFYQALANSSVDAIKQLATAHLAPVSK